MQPGLSPSEDGRAGKPAASVQERVPPVLGCGTLEVLILREAKSLSNALVQLVRGNRCQFGDQDYVGQLSRPNGGAVGEARPADIED